MKKVLISFATPKYYESQKYLGDSALARGGVDVVMAYDENSLDYHFKDKYKDIYKETRGYGFWAWKTQIILDALSKVDPGDIVFYVDSGNLVINNLDYLYNRASEMGIVLFDNRDGNPQGLCWRNINWTKRSCFTQMNADTPDYWYAKQMDAAYQMYRKDDATLHFVSEYDMWCRNYDVISDNKLEGIKEFDVFRDHRHDQSILSVLAVKHGVCVLPEPSEWGNHLAFKPYEQLFMHHRSNVKFVNA